MAVEDQAHDGGAAMGEQVSDGRLVLDRLKGLPGGPQLLAVARESGGGVELVGGAVRDILLGLTPRELDTLVEDDVQAVVDRLAELLDATVTVHERFGTALVRAPGVCIDLVRARAERYHSPGALPEVWPGTLEEDLHRRDFTMNAIAVALDGDRPGELRAAEGALMDLRSKRLRVLHDGSFLDDPTRLLRMARYGARLGFQLEDHTAQLASQALAGGVLSTVSGARVGAELRLALQEPEPLGALREIARLGVLDALHPGLSLEEPLVERALELLPSGDGRPDLLLLASLLVGLVAPDDRDPDGQARLLVDRWQFQSADRDRVVAGAVAGVRLSEKLGAAQSGSELYALAHGTPVEGVALAGARGGSQCERAAERWLSQMRHVRLTISGEDLLGAGVPQGPEIGRRMDAALALLLDGHLGESRDAQLRAALEAQA